MKLPAAHGGLPTPARDSHGLRSPPADCAYERLHRDPHDLSVPRLGSNSSGQQMSAAAARFGFLFLRFRRARQSPGDLWWRRRSGEKEARSNRALYSDWFGQWRIPRSSSRSAYAAPARFRFSRGRKLWCVGSTTSSGDNPSPRRCCHAHGYQEVGARSKS